MENKTGAELRKLVTDYEASKASTRSKLKEDYKSIIDEWTRGINTLTFNLNEQLTEAANAGRSFYVIQSPVIMNDGVASDDNVNATKNVYREKDFYDYLTKNIQNPVTALSALVGAGITITDVSPHIFPVGKPPVIPQNVVFRYKFSW